MSLGKKNISKNISFSLDITEAESKLVLNAFIENIKKNVLDSSIKIASFGTFSIKKTPQRIGRNPKTKKEHIISSRRKLTFKSSNKLKKIIN